MRQFAEIEDLSDLVREALGARFRPLSVERLRGGGKKGVYRLRADGPHPASAIVYRWADNENFWPTTHQPTPDRSGPDGSSADRHGAGAGDPFAPASGLVPFLAAQRRLDSLGVRVPRVLLAHDGHQPGRADIAVVEDVAGGSLEALFESGPARARTALDDLAGMLQVMHQQRNASYGRVDLLERGGTASGASCEQVVADRAFADLAQAAGRDRRIASSARALEDRLRELAGRVAPRAQYGLIHGELGPDHVLVGVDGLPVLIDVEGLMFFDVEWEHVFLRIRFGERYEALTCPGLDPARLDLYLLAMRLSLVAGPLRLLDGDFPDRPFMRQIAECNTHAALALLP